MSKYWTRSPNLPPQREVGSGVFTYSLCLAGGREYGELLCAVQTTIFVISDPQVSRVCQVLSGLWHRQDRNQYLFWPMKSLDVGHVIHLYPLRKKLGTEDFFLIIWHFARGRDSGEMVFLNFPTSFNVAAFMLTSGLGASQMVSGFLKKRIYPLIVVKLVCSKILCRMVKGKVGKNCNVVEARKMPFQQRKYVLLMMEWVSDMFPPHTHCEQLWKWTKYMRWLFSGIGQDISLNLLPCD